jgi:hypothetical protein
MPCLSVQGAKIDRHPADEGDLPRILWQTIQASLPKAKGNY